MTSGHCWYNHVCKFELDELKQISSTFEMSIRPAKRSHDEFVQYQDDGYDEDAEEKCQDSASAVVVTEEMEQGYDQQASMGPSNMLDYIL